MHFNILDFSRKGKKFSQILLGCTWRDVADFHRYLLIKQRKKKDKYISNFYCQKMYFLDVHIPPHHDWNLKVKKCVQWLLYPLRFFVDFPNLYRLHRSQLHFYYWSTHVLFQKNIFCFGILISRIIIKMSSSSHVFWFQRFMEEIMKRTNTTQASSCFQFSIFCSQIN